MIIELLIVLAALYVGSRYGSLALGAISGIGLAILVFGFGLTPGTPPTDVIYIIIAAVTCAGTLQASGGMDWMIQIAERMLRKHPDHITFLGPLVTFFLTVLVGTGHVVYTIMPIICDIALKKNIRPERPCGVSSIASQVGITCSPIAAAVVAFVTISNANGYMVSIPQVLMVTIPACIIGLMCAALASFKRGKDLDKDPDFLKRKADPEQGDHSAGQGLRIHLPVLAARDRGIRIPADDPYRRRLHCRKGHQPPQDEPVHTDHHAHGGGPQYHVLQGFA